eukprot:566571-Hanusia_phi.AAC.1
MAHIMEVYYRHDQDDSGHLSREEAKHALTQLSTPQSKHDEVLDRLDCDGDGIITKEEFYSVLDIIEELSDERLRNIESIVVAMQQAWQPPQAVAATTPKRHSNPATALEPFSSHWYLSLCLSPFQAKDAKAKPKKKRNSEASAMPATMERKHSLNSKLDGGFVQGLVDLAFIQGTEREAPKKIQGPTKNQHPTQTKEKLVNAVLLQKLNGSTLKIYSRLDTAASPRTTLTT